MAKTESWPCREAPLLAVCRNFRTMIAYTLDCERIAVDIPIGLPSGASMRHCDVEAKKLLVGGNPSSLFYAPPAETLDAETPADFQRLHRAARNVGAGLPVWGILPKVKEANVAMTSVLQERIVEFHPELSWFRLAGEALDSKHTREGIGQRRALLEMLEPEFDQIFRWKFFLGKAAALDDLLDAIVGIKVATDSRDSLHRLPSGATQRSVTGLRMEIWY